MWLEKLMAGPRCCIARWVTTSATTVCGCQQPTFRARPNPLSSTPPPHTHTHLCKQALEGAVKQRRLLRERPPHPLGQQPLRRQHGRHRGQCVRRHRGVAAAGRQRQQVAQQQLSPDLLSLRLIVRHASSGLPGLGGRLIVGPCRGSRGSVCSRARRARPALMQRRVCRGQVGRPIPATAPA